MIDLDRLPAANGLYSPEKIASRRTRRAAVRLANASAISASAIGVDETYLATKVAARFFALLWIADVHPLDPIPLKKRDRRGWVVLSARDRRETAP